jgi:hypothetical protein
MFSQNSTAQRSQLAQEVRKRFVTEIGQALGPLATAVQERLTELMGQSAPSREMQKRRDNWTTYQQQQSAWLDGALKDWQAALKPTEPVLKNVPKAAFELVGNEVMENKILASRLVFTVMETVAAELDDLKLRMSFLEGAQSVAGQDILRPDVVLLFLVNGWTRVGLPGDSWATVNDVVGKVVSERLQQAYANCNAFLIKQGVMPKIDLKDRVRRLTTPDRGARDSQFGSADAGRIGGGKGAAATDAGRLTQDYRTGPGPTPDYGRAAEETRLMTSAEPLARARSRALGVMGQIKRLLVGASGADFDATQRQQPSPALAAAMAAPLLPGRFSPGTMAEDYSPAGVLRVAEDLRRRSTDLKNKAETKNEKATIEIVALMFQAILQENRIPASIRVWFARLQMPVLREALAAPDFLGTLNHPARLLIDRMGSCVMGFEASKIGGTALEAEIKRVVEVIEQYPETGRKVYQLVYDEFQRFLARFLTDSAATRKVVSVAQQVEQKETLTIQYTIEMRNMLKDLPVPDEIRQFLYKVWAEVLAMAAVRKGPQDAETLALKKSATDLIWAASAKPNRSDRSQVIQDLPLLLQKLRAGMTLLGVAPSEQEKHIQAVRDTLADAFLSKTQAIPLANIEAMAARLANIENFVSEDGARDLPLDAQSLEMMFGLDASRIEVVADGGSKPSPAMSAWARELQLGAWFTLDHNSRVSVVQLVWRSERKHLNLFASSDARSYLLQAGRLAAYLQAGLLLPHEEEALTVRASREAVLKLEANPERLLG